MGGGPGRVCLTNHKSEQLMKIPARYLIPPRNPLSRILSPADPRSLDSVLGDMPTSIFMKIKGNQKVSTSSRNRISIFHPNPTEVQVEKNRIL